MAFDIVMPQMGESITEATILKWHRKVGEAIGKDETLYEISTDKVDAEIPAPVAGTLVEILVQENATVPVGTVVGRLGDAAERPAAAAAPEAVQGPPAPRIPGVEAGRTAPDRAPEPAAEAPRVDEDSLEGRLRTKSSPLVRRMAEEHQVDLAAVPGTGLMGRVTKDDMEAYLAGRPAAAPKPSAPAPAPAAAKPLAPAPAMTARPASPVPAAAPGEKVRVEPMSRMRRIIADNMVASKHASAHVYTVFEIDMSQVSRLRTRHRQAFEQAYATRLSFMPFVLMAVAKALRAFPMVNASVDGDTIVYKLDINLGVAVALDWGLIVPVIKRADQLNLAGLAQAVNDLAARARSKQLKPEEIQDGTFTITNPGSYGETFGLPIINQPQVAILGMGAVKKRPVVITDAGGEDALAIRETMFSGLSFDHRLIDGATADQFMAAVKKDLETSTFGLE
ncbi:MAG: 2-oxoglutarate dehydrogenase, E2 component, dihydrolipoamide succinyltransferase [Holophaga sp.]|jgi:2-oxoglutarate dehydrogenase E2 component (dihydrolipoamide succinyltransferase)